MRSSSTDDIYDQESVASTSSYHPSSSYHPNSPSSNTVSTMTVSEESIYDEKHGLMGKYNNDGSVETQSSSYQKQNWINPDVVRDIIIGLSDGLTVPFALTAGLSGLDNAKIVVIGGMAELVSGAISMGVGGMLSAQAELDHYRYTQRQTADRVKQSTPVSLNREVQSMFEPLGLSSTASSLITAELFRVEEEERKEHSLQSEHLPSPCNTLRSRSPPTVASFISSRGLTPLLMRMGEGLEESDERRVWQSAITIGSSYFIGGFIPLLPYLFISSVSKALFASVFITAFVLILFGVVKQKCTGRGDCKSLAKSAMSTLAVGAIAAGSSWAIVRALGH